MTFDRTLVDHSRLRVRPPGQGVVRIAASKATRSRRPGRYDPGDDRGSLPVWPNRTCLRTGPSRSRSKLPRRHHADEGRVRDADRSAHCGEPAQTEPAVATSARELRHRGYDRTVDSPARNCNAVRTTASPDRGWCAMGLDGGPPSRLASSRSGQLRLPLRSGSAGRG